MSVPLRITNQRAMDAAREALRAELLAKSGVEPVPRYVDLLAITVIEAYQSVVAQERETNNRVARSSRMLARMEVGDSLVFAAATRGCLRQNMKTSRKLMGNPQASWALHELRTGRIKATRLMDGEAPQRDPWTNLRAVQISRIPVGQSAICPALPNIHALAHNTKIAARRLLGNDTANWTGRTTNKGIRITRVC